MGIRDDRETSPLYRGALRFSSPSPKRLIKEHDSPVVLSVMANTSATIVGHLQYLLGGRLCLRTDCHTGNNYVSFSGSGLLGVRILKYVCNMDKHGPHSIIRRRTLFAHMSREQGLSTMP